MRMLLFAALLLATAGPALADQVIVSESVNGTLYTVVVDASTGDVMVYENCEESTAVRPGLVGVTEASTARLL